MSEKPRLAMYWAAACGGCDIAVLNLHERIAAVAEAFDIVFWPAVMDAKYRDVEAMPDGWIDVTLFSGGIRNSENEELAHLLRRKSRILVAFGSCANEGCIPGLANLSTPAAIFAASYAHGTSTDNPDDVRPQPSWQAPDGELRLPAFLPLLRTLHQVVPVDYSVPGCPPEPCSGPAPQPCATSAPGRATSRRSAASCASRRLRGWTPQRACWSRGSRATAPRPATAVARCARRRAPSASAATDPRTALPTTGPA